MLAGIVQRWSAEALNLIRREAKQNRVEFAARPSVTHLPCMVENRSEKLKQLKGFTNAEVY